MPKTNNTQYAPWQPQAAKVLRTYLELGPFSCSMREMEKVTGFNRTRLGLILNCQSGVNVNFWKRVLVNFIELARHGKGSQLLPMLEEESRRMDLVKYSLTTEVKEIIAKKTR